MHHAKLTLTERELISQWRKGGIANKEIARKLSRHILTIRRELKRNKTRVVVGIGIEKGHIVGEPKAKTRIMPMP